MRTIKKMPPNGEPLGVKLTPPTTRSRSLTWSKEVERRARDYYRTVWKETERTKRTTQEVQGSSDLAGLPFHVQVKARAATWVGTTWRAAHLANIRINAGRGLKTHLVTQDKHGEILVTMRLKDYVDDIASRG